VNFTNDGRIERVLADAGSGDMTGQPIDTVSVVGWGVHDATDFIWGWDPVRYGLQDADPMAETRAKDAVTAVLRPFEKDGAVQPSSFGWCFTAVR
jgi:hypothetical protein